MMNPVANFIMKVAFVALFFLMSVNSGTVLAVAQGFDAEAIESWDRFDKQAEQRYSWTGNYAVIWPCPPLRVQKTDMLNGRNEVFQLLDNRAIYTLLNKHVIMKSIYTLSSYRTIKSQDAGASWMLYESAEWDGTDYNSWDPGSSMRFNGVRGMPQELIRMPWRPRGRPGRLDQSFPIDAVKLLAEDANSQTYQITKGVGCTVDGRIILSKQFRFLPTLIKLETETDQSVLTFDYSDSDITQFRYRIERSRRTSPQSAWTILEGTEDYTIQIDDKVSFEEFDLDYYNVELSQRPQKYPSWIWLVVTGAMLIAIAVWIRRRNMSADQ
ncbi:MAG: hypothetical protein JNL67_08565 [Planctomycetaceae bacterium]|nr:hypothetical protein [Planctomycetaceae bacterium]